MVRETAPPSILIVADDLTGALDSAVAFAGGGRRVTVARGIERIPAALDRAPAVLSVNTASREGSETDAVAAIAAVTRTLPLGDFETIVKKVDSRLKGHVRTEVKELARYAGRKRMVGVPAIPEMGRIQENGGLTGPGIDRVIDLADRMGEAVEAPDATTDAALDRIVAAHGSDPLWIGARGLTFALGRTKFGVGPALPPPDLLGPSLFAIGSRDPVTLAQIETLDRPFQAAPNGAVPTLATANPLDIVVMTEGTAPVHAALAAAAFADGIATRLRDRQVLTLFACGGETAEAILDRLGIGCLDVLAEIAPGVPVSEADVPWGRLRIVTKSGGFGAPDLLRRIAQMAVRPEHTKGP